MQWIIFTSMAAFTQMSSSQKTVGVPVRRCGCFFRPLKQNVANGTVVFESRGVASSTDSSTLVFMYTKNVTRGCWMT